jgi:hypothetical protein
VPTLKLPELLADPEAVKGKIVRVVGQFRGRNLYGDLPAPTFRHRNDWVLKDDRTAMWVTGKAAQGRDFKLNPDAQDDVRTWLEVVGRPMMRDGMVVLRAEKVALVPAPAAARARRRHRRRSTVPPVVVVPLPLEPARVASSSSSTSTWTRTASPATSGCSTPTRRARPSTR